MNRLVGLFCLVLAAASVHSETDVLERDFLSPPHDAKPHTWYHLMNGNVTKEGITADFEALARIGIGGVQMFDAGCNIPAGPLSFNSPEWFDMFRHAASEARRLGLEICIPNCSGWSSSGGPWNMPSNGMKFVTWRETKVKGPSKFCGKLARDQEDNGFYEDIAVVAFPTPAAELRTFPTVKTTIDEKTFLLQADQPFTASGVSYQLDFAWLWSGDATLLLESSLDGTTFTKLEAFDLPLARSGSGDHSMRFRAFARPVTARAIRGTLVRSPAQAKVKVAAARPEAKMAISNLRSKTFEVRQEVTRDTGVAAADQVVARQEVKNILSHLAPDGTLNWDVPAGDWTIVRMGYKCNGRKNHPASDRGIGLEVDKLSAAAMDYHFNQYVSVLCEKLGPLAGAVQTGFNNILVDSYEVGSQNWTQRLEEIFAARRGYSLIPYLPVFAGRIVGSVDETERFLEDFRRVVADLFAENYAGALAKKCNEHGLKLSLEPYGSCPADNLQYGEYVDIPMGEYWSSAGGGDFSVNEGNARFPAYIAHVWGRKFAATESFTASPEGGGRWRTTPFSIKAQGDRVFARGINRIIYHRFTHQPWTKPMYLPGMTMGRWGMHFDRTQTWWNFGAGWITYQSRCQAMLQAGTFVADALFFCGEQAPNQGGNTDGGAKVDMTLPSGYAWDICPTDALLKLRVEDGRIVVPGGVRYVMLVLPPQDTMSARVLAKVDALVSAGAKVCGAVKPTRSPGLVGYPQADGAIAAAAEKTWAKGVMACPPAEALKRLGLKPDFLATGVAQEGSGVAYIHRREGADDWYFVALPNRHPVSFEASFRETGRVPEIWNAETGKIADAGEWRVEQGRTVVRLGFDVSGSAFVVFRRPIAADHVVAVKTESELPPRVYEIESDGKGGAEVWTTVPLKAELTFASGSKLSVAADVPAPQVVDGPWEVSFPNGYQPNALAQGPDETVSFARLIDWIDHPLDGIRYFSGTATYRKTVPCKVPKDARLFLDLGVVRHLAEVTVNGRRLPPLWKPPFRVDVTDAARAGELRLEIRVANLWANRLIGDDRTCAPDCEWVGKKTAAGVKEIGIKEIPQWVKSGQKSPTGRVTFTTWKHWDKDDELQSSGLLGSVRLLPVVRAK